MKKEQALAILQQANVGYVVSTVRETQYRTELRVVEHLSGKQKPALKTMQGTVPKTTITLLVDHEHEGKECTGVSTVQLLPSTTPESIQKAISQAAVAHNPRLILPDKAHPSKVELYSPVSLEATESLARTAKELCELHDIRLAHVEAIAYANHHGVQASPIWGFHYDSSKIQVELALLSKDTESFRILQIGARRFEDLALERVIEEEAKILSRKREKNQTDTFEGPVVLIGEAARDFFAEQSSSYFLFHTSMNSHFQDHTTYELGDPLVSEPQGDTVDLSSNPLVNFGVRSAVADAFGSKTHPVQLVKESNIVGLYGNLQQSTYFNSRNEKPLSPTGGLGNIIVGAGKRSVADLCSGDVVVISNFAHYQANAANGKVSVAVDTGVVHRTDGSTTPFKGGFFETNYLTALSHLHLSSETQSTGDYQGPKAIRIERARVTANH